MDEPAAAKLLAKGSMRIKVAGTKIICQRIDNTVEGNDTFRHVVEFDVEDENVPSHAKERLTKSEIARLREFLADREQLEIGVPEQYSLDMLPDRLQYAASVLESAETINSTLLIMLTESVARLNEVLETVSSRSQVAFKIPDPVQRNEID